MDKDTKELFEVSVSETKTRILATTASGISVELVEHLGETDYPKIIKISETLVDNFGQHARFNRNSIKKYFNYPKTLPFIVKLRDQTEGFIVGVPLEYFEEEEWVKCDENLGKKNTIYTYAFIVRKEHRQFGLSKMLKRVYQSTLKRKNFEFISGHVMEGVASQFTKSSQVVRKFANWNSTGYTFEYYRCPLK
jgi:hypothetical protein